MKKFRFRLQPVLRLRQQQQDQKKRRVTDLIEQVNAEQNHALALAQGLQVEGETLKQQYLGGKVDLAWVAQYRRFVTATQQAINERIRRVGVIQGDLQRARLELTEAAKQTKILEKLREKQKKRHQEALDRTEISQIDDIATRAYARKTMQKHA